MPLPKKQKFLQEIVEPEKKIPEETPVEELVDSTVELTPEELQEINNAIEQVLEEDEEILAELDDDEIENEDE